MLLFSSVLGGCSCCSVLRAPYQCCNSQFLRLRYTVETHRYSYHSPQGSRLNVKSSERKTSPFNTFWYIHLGDATVSSKVCPCLRLLQSDRRKVGGWRGGTGVREHKCKEHVALCLICKGIFDTHARQYNRIFFPGQCVRRLTRTQEKGEMNVS